MFFEELGLKVRGPINDVDVFVSVTLPAAHRGVTHSQTNLEYYDTHHVHHQTAQHTNTFDCFGYDHVNFICARNSVHILRTYRDGLRNFTLINHLNVKNGGAHSVDVSQDLVDGFDLNLVGVGINLHETTIVASDCFIEFINSHDIKVVTCNTPAHTLIRLAKKVYGGQIAGATCDYNRQRTMLETHLRVVKRSNNSSWHVFNAVSHFGETYYQQAQIFSKHLPAFEQSSTNTQLYTFVPSCEQTSEIVRLIECANEQDVGADFLMDYVFVAHFPRVFDIADTPNAWQQIWDLFTLDTNLTNGQLLNTAYTLLHGRELSAEHSLNNTLSTLLFQSRTHVDENKSAFVEHYQQLSNAERLVFDHHLKNYPQTNFSLRFQDNANDYWNTFLREKGIYALCEIAETTTSDVAQDIVERLLQLIGDNKNVAQEVLKDLIYSHVQLKSVHLLKHCTVDERKTIFHTLWNALDVDPRVVSGTPNFQSVIRMAYFNGFWISAWSDRSRWRISNIFERFIQSRSNAQWLDGPLHIACVAQMLDVLDDRQLFYADGAILDQLMTEYHYTVIRQRLARIPQRTDVLECLDDIVAKKNTQRSDGFDQQRDDCKALWFKLLLDLSVEEGQRSTVRKL